MATAAFEHSGFFVLRAPLLPFDTLGSPGGSRALLARLLAMPAVREAIFVASPSLHSQLGTYERDPDSEAGRKVEGALIRYALRMAGRATPFGLFGGCSVGAIGVATRLAVGDTCR